MDIVYQGPAMREAVARARRVAPRMVPVLIEGESGTGKEMFARAIHRTSPRRDKPFVAVNCGAVSRELAESEFFGHRRGAFTGATSDRVGWFEAANEGTLFLDEIGEIDPDLQVKLLRVLQEGQIVRVGTTNPRPVDVRIVAATNRTLASEVASGRFRSDLFFRLAVALVRLPPIRERKGDFKLLVDHLLVRFNRENASDGKIDALNAAVTEMIAAFAEEDSAQAEIQLAVVTFGAEAKLHQSPIPAGQATWQPTRALGRTPLGAALALATDLVEDRERVPSRAYRPTIVLVSDGQPTDDWQTPLTRLLGSERAGKAQRFALAIGADADHAMLAAFLADPEGRVFDAHESRQIKNFFRWVTMSVSQRSRSATPNRSVTSWATGPFWSVPERPACAATAAPGRTLPTRPWP